MKMCVSYYLPEELVDRIDKRSYSKFRNRSQQMTQDLNVFYDLVEASTRDAIKSFTTEELAIMVKALRPVKRFVKEEVLMRLKDNKSLLAKLKSLSDFALFAVWDWAITLS